jgi:hypothetical protein
MIPPRPAAPTLEGIIFEPVDYAGRVYSHFYVEKDASFSSSSCWFIWGCNPAYGGRLRTIVAKPRRRRNWTRRRGGWRTMREALAELPRVQAAWAHTEFEDGDAPLIRGYVNKEAA